MFSRFAVAGLLGAAVACASPAAPSAVLSVFQVSGGLGSGPPATPTVQVDGRRINITAETNTPTPCYTLAPDFRAVDRELRLRVTARDTHTGCVLVVGRFSYNAVITVPAGSYTLVIVHEFPNTGWPTTEILRQSIVVN